MDNKHTNKNKWVKNDAENKKLTMKYKDFRWRPLPQIRQSYWIYWSAMRKD